MSKNYKIGFLRYPITVALSMVISASLVYYLHPDYVKGNEDKHDHKKEQEASHTFLPVYGLDADAMYEEVHFYIATPNNLTLLNKLKLIANKLSIFEFNYLPVNVLKIKTIDDRKIAVIDLKENSNNRVSWSGGYFQGSTGGRATTITLTKTFLYPKFEDDDWIDGIEFLYEGEPIGEWDHINLSDVNLY